MKVEVTHIFRDGYYEVKGLGTWEWTVFRCRSGMIIST